MSEGIRSTANNIARIEDFLPFLQDPVDATPLSFEAGTLRRAGSDVAIPVSPDGIPLFADLEANQAGSIQHDHYEEISDTYIENLHYPHTIEYMNFLDERLREICGEGSLGVVADICCGACESFRLFSDDILLGIGVDISPSMLASARTSNPDKKFIFLQADALDLPIKSDAMDTVVMLGGIHHVNDRVRLFSEVRRILKPGGRYFWREPANDFFVWRIVRSIIYRMSPMLDHDTERPLRFAETARQLSEAGLEIEHWKTHGFLGFCLFMNSDVLVFNRLFRFVPHVRAIVRLSTRLDEWTVALPGLAGCGLQVVGCARKPADQA